MLNTHKATSIAIMGMMATLLMTSSFVVQAQQDKMPNPTTQPPPMYPAPPVAMGQVPQVPEGMPQGMPMPNVRKGDFQPGKRDRPNINPNRNFMRSRQYRAKQMIAELKKLFTEDEFTHIPTLKEPISKYIETSDQQTQLIAQRDSLLFDSSVSKEERIEKFHQFLQQEDTLKKAQKETVAFIKANSDKITSEVITRRDQLRKEIVAYRCKKPNDNEKTNIRRTIMLCQLYEQIENNLPDIEDEGVDPMGKMLLRNVQWFPRAQDLNTTAAKSLLPQLRELHNRQEQVMREASEIDLRLSEIEDLLKLSTK
ncbi:MAG: hypothetical protein PHX74_04785 [Candidatus Sumerlaeales bacterium]|nr:hypothetical protein [Candidatus Sumerlaeales bacterium]